MLLNGRYKLSILQSRVSKQKYSKVRSLFSNNSQPRHACQAGGSRVGGQPKLHTGGPFLESKAGQSPRIAQAKRLPERKIVQV